jgi:hypothetical protein
MTQSSVQQRAAARSTISDFYLLVLGTLLFGYALLGKTVAYIGLPPLYIGEVVFALGVIAFLSSLRCVIASFATLPNLLLALLIGWGSSERFPISARMDSTRCGTAWSSFMEVCVYCHGAAAREA